MNRSIVVVARCITHRVVRRAACESCARPLLLVLWMLSGHTLAFGQSVSSTLSSVPAACPHVAMPATPPERDRREARELVARAQQASIVDDNTTARDLFHRAVQLDPTNANAVYALARLEDASRDAHAAVASYCRFLALAPDAPEAQDVRGRVASLVLTDEPSPHRERGARMASSDRGRRSIDRADASRDRVARDRDVFLLATVVPGLGQYYTHRPAFSALVTAASVGALYYGFEPKTVSTGGSGTRTTRPNMSRGLVAAAVISVLGAVEAASYASRAHLSSVRVDATPSHVGVWVPVALQGRLAVGAVLASGLGMSGTRTGEEGALR